MSLQVPYDAALEVRDTVTPLFKRKRSKAVQPRHDRLKRAVALGLVLTLGPVPVTTSVAAPLVQEHVQEHVQEQGAPSVQLREALPPLIREWGEPPAQAQAQGAPSAQEREREQVTTWQPVQLRQAHEVRLPSIATGRTYRIQVSAIGEPPAQGYPVLLVLDGDGYFPIITTVAQARAQTPAHIAKSPMLVVGVGYSNDAPFDRVQRALDYTPPLRDNATAEEREKYGQADRFYQFLQNELMAFLAQHHPINYEQIALFGHSFGGLYGLYHLSQPDSILSHAIISSPSIWWHEQRVLDYLAQRQPTNDLRLRITVGELEGQIAPNDERRRSRQMVPLAQQLAERLRHEGVEVEYAIYPREDHGSVAFKALMDSLRFLNEDWAKR